MAPKEASKKGGDRQAQPDDAVRQLAYILRGSDGPEARSAKYDEHRVDYFRGKDFYRVLRKNPALLNEHTDPPTNTPGSKTQRTVDTQITEIGERLMQKGYFTKCDRMYKTPRPGRTKRVKYPKYLEPIPRQAQVFNEDGFYVWNYEQPMTWSFVILSFLAAVIVILMCLFPLAPMWAKRTLLYFCMSILGFFFVIFSVRVIVFTIVWVILGRHFWLMPRLTADDCPLHEIHKPLYGWDDLDEYGNVVGRVPLTSRLLATGVVTACVVSLYYIAPENTNAAALMKKSHESILDLFDLNDTPKYIRGNVTNATSADDDNMTDPLEGLFDTPPAGAASGAGDDAGAGMGGAAAAGAGSDSANAGAEAGAAGKGSSAKTEL